MEVNFKQQIQGVVTGLQAIMKEAGQMLQNASESAETPEQAQALKDAFLKNGIHEKIKEINNNLSKVNGSSDNK